MTNQNIVSLDDQQQAQTPGGMIEAQSAKAIQEVQASLVIAKRFPRDELQAHQKIQKACTRPSLAEAGIYTYARGGSNISGPSIRLAEAIAQYWGNLDFGWREIERKGNASVIQAYCWDKETNTRREMTFEVKHVRGTKRGNKALTDERDIYENNANHAARRMRACILALVPGDVVEEAVDQCENTIASQATPERIAKLVEAFKGMGVNEKMIEARIQRNISAIETSQVIDLRKVYASIKDGMSDKSQWFDVSLADQKPAESEKPSLADQVQAAKVEQPEAAPAPSQAPAAPQATKAPAGFPGCDVCHGAGFTVQRETDPETGEIIETKGPCSKCGGQ